MSGPVEGLTFRSDVGVKLIKSMGGDADIIAAARVSTAGAESAEWLERNAAESRGMLNFLMANRHGTPFEHASFTFLIEAPIFVWREFMRHRIGISYNEESGRYKQLAPVFYIPARERALVQEGKPGHYIFVPGTDEQYAVMVASHEFASQFAYEGYRDLLAMGIAKEVARMTLPVNIFSAAYVTMNPRSLMSFLSLRTKDENSFFPSYPQREIEMVAEKMEAIFAELFPITHEVFVLNRRVSP